MPARCYKCEVELTPERCIAMIQMHTSLDHWTCLKCSDTQKPFGVMVESSDGTGNIKNVSRKGGYQLVTIDPRNAEQMRIAKRYIKRSR